MTGRWGLISANVTCDVMFRSGWGIYMYGWRYSLGLRIGSLMLRGLGYSEI